MTELDEHQQRNWAMACHLSALSGCVIPPLGFLLGPLIVWLIKKDQSPLVDEQGKEALNFQLSMTIYTLVSMLLVLVLVGFVLLFGLWVFDIVMIIVAAIKTKNGEHFRYPLTIRFLK